MGGVEAFSLLRLEVANRKSMQQFVLRTISAEYRHIEDLTLINEWITERKDSAQCAWNELKSSSESCGFISKINSIAFVSFLFPKTELSKIESVHAAKRVFTNFPSLSDFSESNNQSKISKTTMYCRHQKKSQFWCDSFTVIVAWTDRALESNHNK